MPIRISDREPKFPQKLSKARDNVDGYFISFLGLKPTTKDDSLPRKERQILPHGLEWPQEVWPDEEDEDASISGEV